MAEEALIWLINRTWLNRCEYCSDIALIVHSYYITFHSNLQKNLTKNERTENWIGKCGLELELVRGDVDHITTVLPDLFVECSGTLVGWERVSLGWHWILLSPPKHPHVEELFWNQCVSRCHRDKSILVFHIFNSRGWLYTIKYSTMQREPLEKDFYLFIFAVLFIYIERSIGKWLNKSKESILETTWR